MLNDLLQYDFLRNAVAAGVLASIICGIIGSYIVVRRIVFISGGISHAAFGGIGLGYYLGFDPVYGAIGFSLVSGFLIALVNRFVKQSEDTIIGILWALGMALGILFISLAPGYAPDLFSYLFGNILTVPLSDIYLMIALSLIVICLVAFFYNDILAASFDEEFSMIQGRPVNLIYFMMVGLVGLCVVMLIKIVGTILVISLLTIPAAVSMSYTKKLSRMMLLSALIGVLFTLTGLYLSYRFDLQSGATIIITASAGYLVSYVFNVIRRRLA